MGQATSGITVGKGMDQVFNELSLSGALPDSYAAYDALLDLLQASEKLHTLGFMQQIRVTEDFGTRLITLDCTVYDFLKKAAGGKARTVQQAILSRFTKAPYVEQLCEEAGLSFLDEYVVGEQECKGLTLAALWNMPALSLAGDKRFIPPFVILTHNSIDEFSGEYCEEKCQVGIISRVEDIALHEKAIAACLRSPVITGVDLLEYAKKYLDRLVFSTEAMEQILAMQRGYPLLSRICSILEELHRAMQKSKETSKPFVPLGFKYTPFESDRAKQGKKGESHTFTFDVVDMKGNKQRKNLLCESHMRITAGQRVYFYVDRGIVYIGHIGRHLPGKKYG